MRGTICVGAALMLMASGSVDAKPVQLSSKKVSGVMERDDGKVEVEWTAWFDRTPEQMRRALTAWKTAPPRLVKDAVEFQLRSTSKDKARFRIEREAPLIFMPNPELTVDARAETLGNGKHKVSWKLVEGTPKDMNRHWLLVPAGSGTLVTAKTKILLPFTPPAFLFPSEVKSLEEDVERVRQVVGAKRVQAKPPKSEQKIPAPEPTEKTSPAKAP